MTSEIRANTIKNRVGLGTIEYSNTGPVISGVTTALNFKTGTSNLHSTGLNIFDLDVDGHTNLDNVSIAGVTTITGALHADGFSTVGGEIAINGTVPRIGFTDSNANSDFRIKVDGGSFQIEDITNSSADRLTINSSGNVSINKDLDVDGHTNLDNVNIAGIVTVTGELSVTDDIIAGDEIRNNVATDFWASDNTFINLNGFGNLTHMGGYETNLTSNGYRDTNGQWVGYNAGSNGGAAQIGLKPQGSIVFRTDASKANGSTHNPSTRLTIDDEGVRPQGGILNLRNSGSTGNITVNVLGVSGDSRIDLENTGDGNYSGIDFVRERSSGTGVVGGSIFMKSDTSSNNALLYIQAQSASAQSPVTSALGAGNGVRLKLQGGQGIFAIETGADERLRITSDGRVFIGESSVAGSAKLVVGNGGAENFEFTSGNSTFNGGLIEYIHRGDGNTRPDMNMYVAGAGAFKVYTNGNNRRLRIHSDGQSEFKADNSNSHFTVGNSSGTMTILDTTTPSAIGVGGRIVFGSTYYNAGATVGGASIGSYKKEGPSNGVGEYRHYLNFHTRNENGIRERVRIDEIGHLSLRNELNSAREIQWWNEVSGSAKAASIGWGNGNANWEFKHFRNDNQADNPYANIDFFTGDYSSPTRALRITNDGNHIREKHTRFATRINYSSSTEAAGVRLTFHSPHVNVGSDFSSSRYTAPVDGTYAFWFFTNVARSGSGSYYATFKKNGSEQSSSKGGRIYDQHSGSGWNNISGCFMIDLQEGDYIEVYNGSQVVNYDGEHYGQFMGWLVG